MFGSKGIITFLEVSAQLGILAVFASLLMIAGEFDLSVGSMIGFAGVAIAIPVSEFGWPIWAAIVFAFGLAVVVATSMVKSSSKPDYRRSLSRWPACSSCAA